MSRLRSVLVGTGVLGILALFALGFSPAQGQVENGSFETGDTTGWDETLPVPLGQAFIDVVTECDAACNNSGFEPYQPIDGNEFALLSADGDGSFTTLSQTLTVRGGTEITGWAFFCDAETACGVTGDPTFCDFAEVNIYVNGVLVDTPFSPLNSCLGNSTDWQEWTFEESEFDECDEVEIVIEARVTNIGDANVSSLMGLDAVEIDEPECVTPTTVPVRTPVPRIGPALGGVLIGADAERRQQQAAAAAATPSGAAIGPVRPPNTGDGGLAETRGPSLLLASVVALTSLGMAGLTLRARHRPRH